MVAAVHATGDKSERDVFCLFDTGASDSFILRSVAEELTTIVKLPQSYRIRLGDNRSIMVEEAAVLAVDVAGLSIMDTFLVLEKGIQEIILGESTMRKYGLKIDMEHSAVFASLNKEEPVTDFLKKLFALLKISPDKEEVSEDEALALIQEKIEEKPKEPATPTIVASKQILAVLELPENATEAEVKGKILALQRPGNVVPLEEHEALKARLTQMEIVSTVDKAISIDKKLAPHERDWAIEEAKKDLAAFQAFLSHKPVIPIFEKLPKKDEDKNLAGARVDDDQKVINKQLGLTDETFAKYSN